MDRRTLLGAGVSASGLMLIRGAAAQAAFPSHALRIFVPFAAGGPTDIMARNVAQKLTDALGQPVVVDNRPGGGAQIAVAALKQTPPDGHAFFIGDFGALAVNASLYRNHSYDPIKDFKPLTMLMSAPIMLLVRSDSPIKSMRDIVSMAKSGRPVTMASTGVGTGGHLALEMLKYMAGIDIVHVPYKGGQPALVDIMGGQVDAMFAVLPAALPQAQGGKVRFIAAGAAKRVAAFPDVQTTAEAGFPDLVMEGWFAAVILAGTPDAIVRRLSTEIGKAMRDPTVTKRFVDFGFSVEPGTPEQLGALMKSEVERWGAVVRRSGARVD